MKHVTQVPREGLSLAYSPSTLNQCPKVRSHTQFFFVKIIQLFQMKKFSQSNPTLIIWDQNWPHYWTLDFLNFCTRSETSVSVKVGNYLYFPRFHLDSFHLGQPIERRPWVTGGPGTKWKGVRLDLIWPILTRFHWKGALAPLDIYRVGVTTVTHSRCKSCRKREPVSGKHSGVCRHFSLNIDSLFPLVVLVQRRRKSWGLSLLLDGRGNSKCWAQRDI